MYKIVYNAKDYRNKRVIHFNSLVAPKHFKEIFIKEQKKFQQITYKSINILNKTHTTHTLSFIQAI